VSVVHFTPCFWARSVVLRLHFQVAIFSSSVPVFFPSIRSWIPDHVRQCLGFCCCFIRRLRPLVSEVLVLVFLCSDQIFSSAECPWPRRRVPSLSRPGLGPSRQIFLSPKFSAATTSLRLASCVARSGV
jgi:hypothetical protein